MEGKNTPEQRQKAKKPVQKHRWFRAILMVMACLCFSVFAAVFILDSAQDLFGLNQPDRMVEMVIPENMSNRQVTDMLLEEGIITKSFTFLLYSSLKSDEGDFQAGTYLFNSNMGYDELIRDLKYGNVKYEEVRLTFIEGYTLQEIAAMLEEERVCKASEFIDYLETATLDYEFVDRMPTDALRFRRFEGYVFPDTYDFYVGERVSSVAKKFLDNFRNRISDDMEAKMMNLGLTLDEAITLASVIQKEAGNPEQMNRVSAVFHNRLRDNATYPNLQSDVTIFYVDKRIKPYIQIKNQPMYDAYNTYVCQGLPVGPICNPGLAAIEAALSPSDDKDNFFVTDVNGEYYYAETADEHYTNVRTARAVKPADEDNTGDVHGTGVQN